MTEMRKEVRYEILLDLYTAYDALESVYFIDILAAYGVDPRHCVSFGGTGIDS